MKAAEARSIAKQKNTASDSKAMAAALSAIKKSAEAGSYSACVYERLTEDAKTKLQADGYKLREWDDQREGYGCEITW